MEANDVPAPYGDGKHGDTAAAFDPGAVAAADAAIEQLQQDANAAAGLNDHRQIRKDHIKKIEDTFRDVYPEPTAQAQRRDSSASSLTHTHGAAVLPFEDWDKFDHGWAVKRTSELDRPKESPDMEIDETNDPMELDGPTGIQRGGIDSEMKIIEPIDQNLHTYDDLNTQQQDALEFFVSGLRNNEQRLMLLHGGPGTGKTFTAGVLVDSLKSSGISCFALSFMWSAVFQLKVSCNKSSIHSAFGLNFKNATSEFICSGKSYSAQAIRAVQERFTGVGVLIIDEISTTDVPLFLSIHLVLIQAFPEKKQLPFAGLSVLCLGDFCQIPPTNGPSLAEILVMFSSTRGSWSTSYDADSRVYLQVANLFKDFKLRVLTTQVRAGGDATHTAMIERFSLKNDTPPLDMAVLQGMQPFSSSLLHNDPAFEDALVAVLSNEERRTFNRLKLSRYAKLHKEPVFRWVQNMITKGGSENGKARSEAWVAAGCHELEYYFVRGLPIVVTSKGKLGHESHGIANGRTGRLLSFTFDPSSAFEIPAAAKEVSGAGQIFDIPQPLYLIVQLTNPDEPATETIPIKSVPSKEPFEAYLKHAPSRTKKAMEKSVPSFRVHFIEPYFAVTYNKLQGATVKRIVLVLNDTNKAKLGKITINKAYVALTRVRMRSHLALFPVQPNELR